MDEELIEAAQAYASQRGRTLGRRLGFGIHGMVCVVQSNAGPEKAALKLHRYEACYQREKGCYERLGAAGVTDLLGFRVPRLLDHDDGLLALEMTIVKPPFVLDFAGAYLDSPPEFSDETLAEWADRWREDWGERWETVQLVLARLQGMGIFMLDPSLSNVRFA